MGNGAVMLASLRSLQELALSSWMGTQNTWMRRSFPMLAVSRQRSVRVIAPVPEALLTAAQEMSCTLVAQGLERNTTGVTTLCRGRIDLRSGRAEPMLKTLSTMWAWILS